MHMGHWRLLCCSASVRQALWFWWARTEGREKGVQAGGRRDSARPAAQLTRRSSGCTSACSRAGALGTGCGGGEGRGRARSALRVWALGETQAHRQRPHQMEHLSSSWSASSAWARHAKSTPADAMDGSCEASADYQRHHRRASYRPHDRSQGSSQATLRAQEGRWADRQGAEID